MKAMAPPAPRVPRVSLYVDEVLELLLHTQQPAVVDGVGGIDQRDLFLVHFANIEVLERSEESFQACRREGTAGSAWQPLTCPQMASV